MAESSERALTPDEGYAAAARRKALVHSEGGRAPHQAPRRGGITGKGSRPAITPFEDSMKLTKEQVAAVVTEASQKMSDPNYSAMLVGGFVAQQTPVAQFISAHDRELGGAEAIVNVIFHCALVAQCFQRNGGRVRTLTYEDLDVAARGEPLVRLATAQLPLHEFIQANIEQEEAQKLVAMIALAIHGTS